MFDPSHKSGLGGWGDPNNDFQITDGAFSTDFVLSYPVPHRVRRNFTLQPFINAPLTTFDDGSTAIDWDYKKMINTTFTRESQIKMVHKYIGDFAGFQAFMEGSNVSGTEYRVRALVYYVRNRDLILQYTQLLGRESAVVCLLTFTNLSG